MNAIICLGYTGYVAYRKKIPTPRWQLSAILISVSHCFHIALLYKTDHVSENNFNQTEIDKL